MLIPSLPASAATEDAERFVKVASTFSPVVQVTAAAALAPKALVKAATRMGRLRVAASRPGDLETALAEAAAWLAAGALEFLVEVDAQNQEAVLAALVSSFPAESMGRFVLAVRAGELAAWSEEALGAARAAGVRKVHAAEVEGLEAAKALQARLKKHKLQLSVHFAAAPAKAEWAKLVGELHKLGKDDPVHVVLPEGLALSPESLASESQLLASTIVACMPEGIVLHPTVIVDERGVALGLVYSNEASVAKSIELSMGAYWSRSRNELWIKGLTSKAEQDLLGIDLDCDGDGLLFTVFQRGAPPAFCHRNVRTCWGEDGGIPNLFRVLESRKIAPPPGSYTARLFNEPGFLKKKLFEEANELMEAVGETDAGRVQHVNEETADVLYMALTACVAGGGSLQQVERELDRRALAIKRRKGDAKPARVAEVEQALQESKRAKLG